MVAGWSLVALIIWRVWDAKVNYQPYNPFDVLGVPEGSTEQQITRAFRRLSLKYHPDKIAEDGKEEAERRFLEVSKAYKALTDEKARKNWEDYGNPDGPRGFSLGIALPAWLVQSRYSFFFLLAYIGALMLGVPWLVKRAWGRWRLYTKDGLLHDSMRTFYRELKEGHSVKKLFDLIPLADEWSNMQKGSLAFWKADKTSINQFIAKLSVLSEEAGCAERYETPKRGHHFAHALLYAHLFRLPISEDLPGYQNIQEDQQTAVALAVRLVQGMLKICIARTWLPAILNCAHLTQMLIQGLWEGQSPLLQLPGMDTSILKHCKTKKRTIRTIQDLLKMDPEDRRSLLRNLSDEQYDNLLRVAASFVQVRVQSATFKILGQENITPEGLITAQVRLKLFLLGDENADLDSSPVNKPEDENGKEVETFEFDEDGNLMESSAGKVATSAASPSNQSAIKGSSGSGNPYPLHCPLYPLAKEAVAWWIIITNRAATGMICPPVLITDLVHSSRDTSEGCPTKTVTLQFPSPPRPGQVQLSIHVIPDSLVGSDLVFETGFKVVSPAAPATSKNNGSDAGGSGEDWDISGEEDSDDQQVPFGDE